MAVTDAREDVGEEAFWKVYYIFGPVQARSLRNQWPELKTVDALDALPDDDLVFVWWYANRTSPFEMFDDVKRAKLSIGIAYRNDTVKLEARMKMWENLDFGHQISSAIKAMMSFDPDHRIQAYVDDMHMLKQLQSVMRKDVSEADVAEFTEWSKAVREARKLRDEIIARLEMGAHGVTALELDGSDPLKEVAAEFIINYQD